MQKTDSRVVNRDVLVVDGGWDADATVAFYTTGSSSVINIISGGRNKIVIPIRPTPYTPEEKDTLRRSLTDLSGRLTPRPDIYVEKFDHPKEGILYGIYAVQ